MDAEYLFYMKSIETYARAFLALIILGIGTVCSNDVPKFNPSFHNAFTLRGKIITKHNEM